MLILVFSNYRAVVLSLAPDSKHEWKELQVKA